jgi:hypothetical protein
MLFVYYTFFGSAPRWHLLSWVIAWNELEQTCIKLLNDPTLRYITKNITFCGTIAILIQKLFFSVVKFYDFWSKTLDPDPH